MKKLSILVCLFLCLAAVSATATVEVIGFLYYDDIGGLQGPPAVGRNVLVGWWNGSHVISAQHVTSGACGYFSHTFYGYSYVVTSNTYPVIVSCVDCLNQEILHTATVQYTYYDDCLDEHFHEYNFGKVIWAGSKPGGPVIGLPLDQGDGASVESSQSWAAIKELYR